MQRRVHQRPGAVQQRGQLGRAGAGRAGHARLTRGRGRRAGQHQRGRVLGLGPVAGVGGQQAGQVLARLGVAHEQQRPVRAVGAGARAPARPGPGPWGATTTRAAVGARARRPPRRRWPRTRTPPRRGAGGAAVGAQRQPAPDAAVVAAHAGEGHVVHGGHLRHADPAAVGGQRVVHHVGRGGPGRPGQAPVQPELVQRGVGGAAQRGCRRRAPAAGAAAASTTSTPSARSARTSCCT